MSPFDLAGLKGKLKELDEQTHQQSFWDDHENAQKVMKEKKSLENKIDNFHDKIIDVAMTFKKGIKVYRQTKALNSFFTHMRTY